MKLAYKKVFGGINWLTTLDRYSIPFYSVTQNATGSVDISVRDFDALIGYMIIPRIGVFAGYKSISSNMTNILGHSFDFKLKGAAFGATANLPLGNSPFLFSVNGSYMPFLKYTFLENARYARQDMHGYTVEIWFTYAGLEHIAFSIGGKAQTFESELKDRFQSSGLTFSLGYRF